MLLTLLVVAATAYAFVVAAMFLAQRSLLYPGASGDYQKPSGEAPWGEWVEIATADGETLAALRSIVPDAKATFIYFHGNADDIAAYGFLAEALAARRYGLLAVSFRGYAGSSGYPSEAGLLQDGLAAFDWLAARSDRPILLLGRSLGSGVAVGTAAERPAEGLVLVSAYQSILAVARRQYPYLPVGPLIKNSFRSDLRIRGVSQPKLFLHGDRDSLIPPQSGRRLYEAAPEPKDFVMLRGSGHNDVWTADLIGHVTDFADRTVSAAGGR